MVFICLNTSESLSPPKEGNSCLKHKRPLAFLSSAPSTCNAAQGPECPAPSAGSWRPSLRLSLRLRGIAESGQRQTSYRVITVTLLRLISHFSQSCVLAFSRTSVSSNANRAFSTQIFCRTSPVLSRWQAQQMLVELK